MDGQVSPLVLLLSTALFAIFTCDQHAHTCYVGKYVLMPHTSAASMQHGVVAVRSCAYASSCYAQALCF